MENPFTDVAEDAYYCKPVLWAKAQGITGGTSATTFSPDATCTRGQVVMFLWRSAGSPQPKSTANPFTDVSESDYFYTAVLWAKENGITGGTSATTFGPDAPCTRAHVATFLWRSEGSPEPKNGKNPFTDVGDSDYFRTAVLWAVENQVTSGIGQGLFGPDAPCTRGQIVTFLYKTSLIPEEN